MEAKKIITHIEECIEKYIKETGYSNGSFEIGWFDIEIAYNAKIKPPAQSPYNCEEIEIIDYQIYIEKEDGKLKEEISIEELLNFLNN